MSKILVISSNQALVKIYKLRISDSFGVDICICTNFEQAQNKLEKSKEDYVLIICPAFENECEVGALIYQYTLEADLSTPVIIYGDKEYCPEELEFLENEFDLGYLCETLAKYLKQENFKSLEENYEGEFRAINIKLLSDVESLPCTLYLLVKRKQEEKYIRIFEAFTTISLEVQSFIDNGIEALFVKKSDHKTLMDLISGNYIESLGDNQSSQAKASDRIKYDVIRAEKGMKILAQKIFNSDVLKEEVVCISKYCLETIDEIITEVPNIIDLCELLRKNVTGYLYSHSVIANSIARYIAGRLSWTNSEHIKIINNVFFFGDLYLATVFDKYPHFESEEEALFSELLTDEEKLTVLTHAKIASEAIKDFPHISQDICKVIKEHHGMVHGEGFALKFKDDIAPVTKIIVVSECYAEQLLKKRDSNITDEDKKEIIEELLLQFEKESYHIFIEILADIDK